MQSLVLDSWRNKVRSPVSPEFFLLPVTVWWAVWLQEDRLAPVGYINFTRGNLDKISPQTVLTGRNVAVWEAQLALHYSIVQDVPAGFDHWSCYLILEIHFLGPCKKFAKFWCSLSATFMIPVHLYMQHRHLFLMLVPVIYRSSGWLYYTLK